MKHSAVLLALACSSLAWSEDFAPISQRFSDPAVSEEPSFQKHVVPLLGRQGWMT